MNPGFSIFGLSVKWYGVIIAVGMLLAILFCIKMAKKRNIKADDFITVALFVIPLSILCARIYYVVFSGESYTFAEFWQIWNGGMAIYGGVIGGAIGLGIYCLIFKKNFLDFADIIVPGLILAQGIGRWGNFVNQEAFGVLIENPKMQWFPFAVYIQSLGEWHAATFFYESIWNFIGFAVLFKLLCSCKSRGLNVASYFVFYGVGRFFIEGLRTDSLYVGSSSIRVSQLLSIILVVAGVAWITLILINNRKKARLTNDNKNDNNKEKFLEAKKDV